VPASAGAGSGSGDLDSFGLPSEDAPADGIDPDVALAGAGAVATITAPTQVETLGDEAPVEIPLGISTGIAICAGFTVLFGLWPSPIIDFAHAATLLIH